ncbi:peptidoglycan-binding domain-containing protein, partial [Streptomyces fradiae]
VAAVAAVVAVAGTVAFVGGLFDGDGTSDRVAPNPSAPPWPSPDGVTSPSPDPSASVPPRTSEGPTAAPTSPDGSASRPSAAPSPYATRTVRPSTAPAPRTEESAPARPGPRPEDSRPGAGADTDDGTDGATLSRGDRGEEVLGLQQRLRSIGFYDNAMNGRYDKNVERAVAAYQQRRGIGGDSPGVYGPETRRALEGETGG